MNNKYQLIWLAYRIYLFSYFFKYLLCSGLSEHGTYGSFTDHPYDIPVFVNLLSLNWNTKINQSINLLNERRSLILREAKLSGKHMWMTK